MSDLMYMTIVVVYNSTMYNNSCIHIKYVKLAYVAANFFAVVGEGVCGLFSRMGCNGGSERAV